MARAARCLLLASLACCVSAAHGNCIPDDGLGNTTCQSPDEHSFVQSWKRTDRAPPGPQPLPAARQLGLMWAPAMWLVLLVPFAAMQFWTGAKPQKSATEALLHGGQKWSSEAEQEGSSSREDVWLDVAGLRDLWLLEVQRQRHGASLLKVLLRHCLSESWMANAYGTCIGALGFAANLFLSIALGQLLDGVRRGQAHGFDGLMVVLTCAVLPSLVGFLEAASCTRNARFAARCSAALMGLLGTKATQLPATKVGVDPLAGALRLSDQVGEAVPCLWRAAMACAQVAVLLAWLWKRWGAMVLLAPLGFAPLLPVTALRLRGLVQPYVSYETAAQRRHDFVAASCSKHGLPQVSTQNFVERAQHLRREELGFLWVMHNLSYQVALLAARWPQVIALACVVAIAALAPTQPEVLLPLFLQLHCLLRQLSVCSSSVTKLCAVEPSLARVEAFLSRRELGAASPPEEGLCLHLSGSFAWEEEAEIESLPVLVDLDLKVPRSSLLAVLGTSGAGKTSLLHAASGALQPLADAFVQRTPSALLLPSTPWIFPGSMQANILCGRSLELQRYQEVLQALGLEAVVEDPESTSMDRQARIALARAAYGSEDLVLMDDPFCGMAASDAEQIIREVLQGPLFAGRSCIVTFGSDTARLALAAGGFSNRIVLEGGAMAVNGTVGTEDLQGTWVSWAPSNAKPLVAGPECQPAQEEQLGGVFGALAFLQLAGRCQITCVYLLLLVDQILQTGLDWFVLVAALNISRTRSLFSFHWQLATCWINFMLKLVLARAAASCCTAAGESFHAKWLSERIVTASSKSVMQDMKVVDLGLSHQVWVLLALLCSSLGLLCLVHVRLPHPLYGLFALPAYMMACWFLWQNFCRRVDLHRKRRECQVSVSKVLHDCFAPGAAARLMAQESHVLEVEEATLKAYARRCAAAPSASLMVQLSLCLSAAYTVAGMLAISSSDDVLEVGLTLAPLALLVHFLVPCVDALSGFEEVGAAAGRLAHELERKVSPGTFSS